VRVTPGGGRLFILGKFIYSLKIRKGKVKQEISFLFYVSNCSFISLKEKQNVALPLQSAEGYKNINWSTCFLLLGKSLKKNTKYLYLMLKI
jgi:hypothetical protein